MDLDFSLDTDHRKRRRNRTTQSCLNCHTSKRKCDRKRPCQRCIQLGLTGLCVYEIDDPALRDDPSVDENTRLRNRIAELESLVRELRGKPHPRWADSNFRDGDPNEKWHSRATKCMSAQKRGSQPQSPQQPQQNGQHTTDSGGGGNASGGGGDPRNGVSTRGMQSLLSPIKSEPITDTNNNAHLYRFSPSPAPSMRYHTFQQGDVRAGPDSQAQSGYPTTNGATTNGYHHSSNSTGSHYSDNGAGGPYSDDGKGSVGGYGDHFRHCPCRTNPALGLTYISLSQTLQSSLNTLRQFSHHPSSTQCMLLRRIVDLNNALHGHDSPRVSVAPSYESGQTSDSEIMTPLSASSGPTSFHAGSPDVSPQEWNHIATAGFNPYFPAQDHHSVYSVGHVIS